MSSQVSKPHSKSQRSSAPLAALSKSIEEFIATAENFPADLAKEKPTGTAFSATEIVYHMISVEELWQQRLQRLIAGISTEFVAMNPDNVAREGKHNELDIATGISKLRSKRQETISMVSDYSDEELDRVGQHQKYGPMTVLQILSLMEGHDRNHAAQLDRTLTAIRISTSSIH